MYSLDTNRPIEIYGDADWGLLFPKYYQQRYLGSAEKKQLFSKSEYLFLLLNANYTYLESNGVVLDALAENLPFIGLPALVKTKEFEAFSSIE